jgi:iron complex transport system substrate-binding protein
MWKHRLRSRRGHRLRALVTGVLLAAGVVHAAPAAGASGSAPERIVSINLCTDQIVLALDLGERLVAVSSLATDRTLSVHWRAAESVEAVPAALEPILLRQPDLVVAGGFGHGRLVAQLERLGVAVLRVPEPASLADVPAAYLAMGRAVGAETRAQALAAEFDAVLGAPAAPSGTDALLLATGLLVHGEGMLGGDVLRHAGLANAAGAPALGGQAYLSLERVVASPPDLVLVARADASAPSRSQHLFSHPALVHGTRIKPVPPSALICGTVETARLAASLAAPEGQAR